MVEVLVTIDQIAAARERLPPQVVQTPMLLSEKLSHRTGARVYFESHARASGR
jgi:threonine dehydratase